MRIGDQCQLTSNKKILIIGGGPAGTSATICAAKFGLSVTSTVAPIRIKQKYYLPYR